MTTRTVAGIGIFTALAYAGSFVLMVIPNATLSILIVFFAGYCIGRLGGFVTGVVSSALISLFNPYGMVVLPLLLAQLSGYSLVGLLGGAFAHRLEPRTSLVCVAVLGSLGVTTALLYHVPVSIVDAWLFGPFRERLIVSLSFVMVTVLSNLVFFVVFFPILAKLQKVVNFSNGR